MTKEGKVERFFISQALLKYLTFMHIYYFERD